MKIRNLVLGTLVGIIFTYTGNFLVNRFQANFEDNKIRGSDEYKEILSYKEEIFNLKNLKYKYDEFIDKDKLKDLEAKLDSLRNLMNEDAEKLLPYYVKRERYNNLAVNPLLYFKKD